MTLRTIVNSLVALSLLGGCSNADSESKDYPRGYHFFDCITGTMHDYRLNDESKEILETVLAINSGLISVSKDYTRFSGRYLFGGKAPTMSSNWREFDELYTEADTNRDGIVDVPEAEALYQKTIGEAIVDSK